MSHFSVLVVGEDIDGQLAPYMENCCDTPDKRFMEFYDDEDDMRTRYESESREYIVMPDGRLLLPWDDEFNVPFIKGDISTLGKKEIPESLERRTISFKEKFSTFEEFAQEWCGQKARDPEKGRYGHWQNPNAKWDWFMVGGRFAGHLKLLPGREGVLIGEGINPFSEELATRSRKYNEKLEEGRQVDQAVKKDIDFETMRRVYEEGAAKRYDKVWEAIKDTPVNKSWEEMIEDIDEIKDPAGRADAVGKAREEYHDQPRVKAFLELSNTDWGRENLGWMSQVDKYNIERGKYLQNSRDRAITTFALVKDGKWFERGDMGWWGIVSAEKDEETWNSMFSKVIDELPGDTLLTVVDCHI